VTKFATLWRENMSSNDRIMLDTILKQKKQEIASSFSESDYFEIFTAEQILKDFDLSYDEIQTGTIGGSGDGGIDSAYLFVNGDLILEDTELEGFKKDIVIEVVFIQSKITTGFSEESINKFVATTGELLDLSKEIKEFNSVYNKDLLETIALFRKVYEKLATKFPTLRFSYFYATKGDEPHQNVLRKVKKLEETIKQLFSSAQFSCEFIGARELLELARRAPKTTYSLSLAESPISSTGAVGYICLVRISDYFSFITDEKGKLRRHIFEANVRDYQGDVQVNDGIRKTLIEKGHEEDFWWLNNGITIIATQATQSGKMLTIENPQIVNGLQTSTEVYKYFEQNNTAGDNRNILVRVIVPKAVESRDRIIKATNSQTRIPDASLRATEKIHRDIEEFFHPHGLFYDRRKNLYKNEGKPIEKIISITQLAQAIMSIALGKPDSARARPSSLLKRDEDYKRVFSPDYPLPLYLFCAKLLKRIEQFVKSSSASLDTRTRINLKFHLAMYAAMMLAGKSELSPKKLSELQMDKIDDNFLSNCLKTVRSIYEELGETDQTSKGPDFPQRLKESISNT
jgi:hypothetical protein